MQPLQFFAVTQLTPSRPLAALFSQPFNHVYKANNNASQIVLLAWALILISHNTLINVTLCSTANLLVLLATDFGLRATVLKSPKNKIKIHVKEEV